MSGLSTLSQLWKLSRISEATSFKHERSCCFLSVFKGQHKVRKRHHPYLKPAGESVLTLILQLSFGGSQKEGRNFVTIHVPLMFNVNLERKSEIRKVRTIVL